MDTIDSTPLPLPGSIGTASGIVTLEGELLSAGGSMTGGAFKNSSNLLGRRREIEELENTCSKALVQVEKIQKELALKKALPRRKRENWRSCAPTCSPWPSGRIPSA